MRRIKILVLCQGKQSPSDCVKEWYQVLRNEVKGVKTEEYGRVSTPYVIMDFVRANDPSAKANGLVKAQEF